MRSNFFKSKRVWGSLEIGEGRDERQIGRRHDRGGGEREIDNTESETERDKDARVGKLGKSAVQINDILSCL